MEPGDYSWRVRAKHGVAAGPWSAWQGFTIPDDEETPPVCNEDGVCDPGETEGACPLDNCGPSACTPSVQSFTMTSSGPLSGETHVGIEITFAANTANTTPGLPILWDLGTGEHREGATITYTYNQPGEYTVVMTTNDLSCGETQLTPVVVPVTPLACYWQAARQGWQSASCRPGDASNACYSGETVFGEGSSAGCGLAETCCVMTLDPVRRLRSMFAGHPARTPEGMGHSRSARCQWGSWTLSPLTPLSEPSNVIVLKALF